MDTTEVLIADDSRQFREALRELLDRQETIVVVAEATDGREAVRQAGEYRPQVVLMDIEMPVIDGIEATREIRSSLPAVQVIALSLYDKSVFREAMAAAGAWEYVLKDADISELVAAIRKAAAVGGTASSEQSAGSPQTFSDPDLGSSDGRFQTLFDGGGGHSGSE